jgi:hypothetical protein
MCAKTGSTTALQLAALCIGYTILLCFNELAGKNGKSECNWMDWPVLKV